MPISYGPLSYIPISAPVYPAVTNAIVTDSPSTTDSVTAVRQQFKTVSDNPSTCSVNT